jgi:hypothetical protein
MIRRTIRAPMIFTIIYYYLYLIFFYLFILFYDKIKLGFSYIKKVLITLFSYIGCIKLGSIYAKKNENHFYGRLGSKISKKYLNLKLEVSEIMQDLNFCTKYGRLFYYRKIKGFLDRSLFISVTKKVSYISGFFVFMHKTKNIGLDLTKYT